MFQRLKLIKIAVVSNITHDSVSKYTKRHVVSFNEKPISP